MLCGEIHAVRIHAVLMRKIRNRDFENVEIGVFSIVCGRAKEQGKQYTKRILPPFVIPECNITLENVLEQIVGPVRDEFDVESPEIVPEGEGRYLVLGGAPISRLAELLGRPVEAEGVDTVAGLVALRLGRVPDTGDRLPLERTVLEVLEVRQNHATRLRLFTGPDAAADAAAEGPEPASDTAEDGPAD